MKSATPSLIAAALALATSTAQAASLGEVSLRSRIGERLLAEIPIQIAPGEALEIQCFSLQGVPGGDLPSITNARIKLWRNESSARLVIEGNQALLEPISVLRIKTGCNQDSLRDYVLMPDSPSNNITPVRVVETRLNEAEGYIHEAAPKRQGPNIARSAARPHEVKAHRENAAPRSAPITQVVTSQPRGPHLRLGMPSESDMKGAPGPESSQLAEMSSRVLQMESSLSSLREEVDKLHGAVEVGAQAMAMQHELQLASQLQNAPPTPEPEPAPAAGPVLQLPPVMPQTNGINWLQLLSAAFGGGLVSSLIAAFLIRRSLRDKK